MVKKPPGADGRLRAGGAASARGAVRSAIYVLGTRIITGTGKHLRFGGEVMKTLPDTDLTVNGRKLLRLSGCAH